MDKGMLSNAVKKRRIKEYTYNQKKIGKKPLGESERDTWERIHGKKSPYEIEDEREIARRKRKAEKIRAQKEIDRELGY